MQTSMARSGATEIQAKPMHSSKSIREKPQFHQLQEELRKAREERTRALEDLEELRSNKRMLALRNKAEMENLQKKVEKANESERKILDSLTSQTKLLEQTKMLLEEAKLEIHELRDGIGFSEGSSSRSRDENGKKHQIPLALIRAQEEIRVLRNELRLATEAEEKSKTAMDDLAIALKEVTTEAHQVKVRFSAAQSELEKVKFESEQSKYLLKATADELRAAVEESEMLKLESEDLDAVLKEKENAFWNCMKVSEEEIIKLKSENDRLIESLSGSRDETSKLRDIVKQAVSEATMIKEALEIARNENSRLKGLLSEKENTLQRIRQEYECLKVSEAAAADSVKELKGFLAVAPSMDSASKIPSVRLWNADSKSPSGPRHPAGGSGKCNGRNPLFASLSNASESRVPSFLYTERKGSLITADFEHIARTQSNGMKKKPVSKRFGGMLRRKSFHM